ncbi:MAG: hypothetical protein H0U45_14545 [Tatlockia sp.]|jgi:hypothetical protein|nr:hypothetical protein [Tatlockia sp.]
MLSPKFGNQHHHSSRNRDVMTPLTSYSVFLHGQNASEEEISQWMHSIQSDYSYNVSYLDVPELLKSELISQLNLFTAWGNWFEFDIYSLHLANVFSKRILYAHKPYFYLAPWTGPHKIKGVNTRLFLAIDEGHSFTSTRFESISQLPFNQLSSYYAFRIQYRSDSHEQHWQLIQPSLLVAPSVCQLFEAMTIKQSQTIIRNLRLLMSISSHDYVHSTMMRWFHAPNVQASEGYKKIMFENGPPPELDEWHQTLSNSCWVRLNSGKEKKIRDILEYQAAFIHRKNLNELLSYDECYLDVIRQLTCQIDGVLAYYSDAFENEVSHLSKVVSWFLLAMFPLEKLLLLLHSWELEHFSPEMMRDVSKNLFWGFYELLDQLEDCSFQWGGNYQNIRIPFLHYADGLKQFVSRTSE